MQDNEEQGAMEDHRLSLMDTLNNRLDKILMLSIQNRLSMHTGNVLFGIASDEETYTSDYRTYGSYEPVAHVGSQTALVIYAVGLEVHFGLFDEQLNTCLPISAFKVVHIWNDDEEFVEREILARLLENVDRIIARSTGGSKSIPE